MFFMMGITQRQEEIDFDQTIICDVCGSYGRLMMFVTYSVLTLFFIPVFKWDYHYYVRTTCCNSLYEIDEDLGKAIVRGDVHSLNEGDLHMVRKGRASYKKCFNCGYETDEDFDFCPKCGTRF